MNRRQFLTGTAATGALLALKTDPAWAWPARTPTPCGGVATHLSYFNTPYGDSTRTARGVKALGARWARDSIPTGQGDSWYDRVYRAVRQVHAATPNAPATSFCMIGGHPAEPVGDTLDVLEPLVRDGIVQVIEGANEWDLNADEHEGVTPRGWGC